MHAVGGEPAEGRVLHLSHMDDRKARALLRAVGRPLVPADGTNEQGDQKNSRCLGLTLNPKAPPTPTASLAHEAGCGGLTRRQPHSHPVARRRR